MKRILVISIVLGFCISAFADFEESMTNPCERQSMKVGDFYYRITPNAAPEVKLIRDFEFNGPDTWPYPSISDVNIPENVTYDGTTYSVTSIARNTFSGGAKTFTLPKTIRIIEERNIYRVEDRLTLNEGLEILIGHNVVSCDIATVKLPESLHYIGDYSFSYNQFKTIEFSEGLCRIGKNCFSNNPELEALILPSSIENIGEESFCNNISLRNVVLPRGVETPENCFNGCPAIERIEMPAAKIIPYNIVEMWKTCFKDVDWEKCVVVVPDGQLEDYKKLFAENTYSQIKHIVEKHSEGSYVKDSVAEEIEGERLLYTIDGLPINLNSDSMTKGLVISRQGGKSEKIFLK